MARVVHRAGVTPCNHPQITFKLCPKKSVVLRQKEILKMRKCESQGPLLDASMTMWNKVEDQEVLFPEQVIGKNTG